MHALELEIARQCKTLGETCRLFHGRGHCFPGYEDLLIDWFEPVVLITLYQNRSSNWLKQLVLYLTAQIPGVRAVILQQRFLPHSPSIILDGCLPEKIHVHEMGLKYRLALNSSQNIGFFPDAAVVRSLLRECCEGKKVLNLFAYSCSFSVAALAGGARQVVNVDMSKNALALGKLNHEINGIDSRAVSFLGLEIFRSFSRLKKLSPFDLIICDPPAEQGKSFLASRDWPRLVKKLPLLLKTGGEIITCTSSPHVSPRYIQGLFQVHCPHAELLERLRSGERFPEVDDDKGFNALRYRMRRRED